VEAGQAPDDGEGPHGGCLRGRRPLVY
jgi:hypothetical protein